MAARRSPDDEDEYEYEFEDEDEYEDAPEVTRFEELRRWATIPLILILFGFGVWFLWQRHGENVLSHASYRLDPQKISHTPAPEWLHVDILDEVIRDGSLEEIDLHQPDVTVRVRGAFELHRWVKHVEHAYKEYPAGMDVGLEYRTPVGMVVLPIVAAPGDDPDQSRAYMQPIDNEATILDGRDVVQHDATGKLVAESRAFLNQFPRIDIGQPTTEEEVGRIWSEPAIVDAAKLAELLCPDWTTLKEYLFQIQLSSKPTSTTATPDFDILGRPELGITPGLVIHWGRAPGKELAGEPTAKAKLVQLKELLNSASSEHPLLGEFDLRTVRARTAANVKHNLK